MILWYTETISAIILPWRFLPTSLERDFDKAPHDRFRPAKRSKEFVYK